MHPSPDRDAVLEDRAHPPRLLVVEDDDVTRTMIVSYMAAQSFVVSGASTAGEALDLVRSEKPDLIFVDVQLPDSDGFTLARTIRAASAVGIIFVTQKDGALDRVRGLETAGDDYVTKPIDLRELLARTRALLRRRELERKVARAEGVVTFGIWLIDHNRRELTTSRGEPLRLTRGEFDLVSALVRADGRTLSRDYLVEVVSNRLTEVGVRTVDALIARIRRKLGIGHDGPSPIETVSGAGYRLAVRVDPAA